MLKKDRRRNRREEGMEEDRKWGEKKGRKEGKKEEHPSYPMGKSLNVYFTKKNIQMANIKNVQPIGH